MYFSRIAKKLVAKKLRLNNYYLSQSITCYCSRISNQLLNLRLITCYCSRICRSIMNSFFVLNLLFDVKLVLFTIFYIIKHSLHLIQCNGKDSLAHSTTTIAIKLTIFLDQYYKTFIKLINYNGKDSLAHSITTITIMHHELKL